MSENGKNIFYNSAGIYEISSTYQQQQHLLSSSWSKLMILLPTDRKRAYLPPQLTHKWEQVSINPLPFKSQMQKMWVFTSGCFSKFCTLLKLIFWMVVAYWRWVWTNMSVMSTQLVGNLSIHGQVDSFDMFIAHRQWEKRPPEQGRFLLEIRGK